MNCKEIQSLIPGFVDGTLENQLHEEVENHINHCKDCNDELDKMVRIVSIISKVAEVDVPNGINKSFDKMLKDEKSRSSKNLRFTIPINHPAFRVAASILLVITGILIGYNIKPKSSNDELSSLKQEMTEMKNMVVFSMLRQESASERIKAVSFVNEISNPDPKLVETLLTTLNNDRNVNVRLAAAQALSRFKDNKLISDLLVKSLEKQSEPLVQIMLINLAVEDGGINARSEIEKLLLRTDLNQDVKSYTEKRMKSISL